MLEIILFCANKCALTHLKIVLSTNYLLTNHYIYIYIYIYIYTYVVYSISFQTFFVQAFKIVVDS